MAIPMNVGSTAQRDAAIRLERIVTRENLILLIDRLGGERELIGPVARHEPECEPPVRFFYERVASADQLALDFTYCVFGPKPWLLPPRETLLRYEWSNGRFSSTAQIGARPAALIGIHPCDVHAIRTLDAAFAQPPGDEHYAARREQLFIVGIDCAKPCADGVFCGDRNTHHADGGYDVMLYTLDGEPGRKAGASRASARYGAVFGSDAGRAWFASEPKLSQAAGEAERAELQSYQKRKQALFPSTLGMQPADAAKLAEHSYASRVWDSEAQRCYGCGSCNLVCPTCFCFDIHDESDLPVETGARQRCWDACMLRDFALVAGGHNFRANAASRLRHRMLRKMVWIERRTGAPGCVGCGRCDRACTARISIVDTMKRLARGRKYVGC